MLKGEKEVYGFLYFSLFGAWLLLSFTGMTSFEPILRKCWKEKTRYKACYILVYLVHDCWLSLAVMSSFEPFLNTWLKFFILHLKSTCAKKYYLFILSVKNHVELLFLVKNLFALIISTRSSIKCPGVL